MPQSQPPARTATLPLLRQLRERIAQPAESRQEQLNEVTRFIAAAMVAEVCAIYLRTTHARTLELAASEGLKPDSVHRTRLQWGEGLIGFIAAQAQPLNLAEAKTHPAFAARPETGEDAYASLMGVPIMRRGQVVGVLTIQNRQPRRYSEDDLELLHTLALITAEALELDMPEPATAEAPSRWHLKGAGWGQSVALGHIVLHEPHLKIEKLVANDPAIEHERLDDALNELQKDVERLISNTLDGNREIFETYRMFASDRAWINRMHEAITSGLTAEAAVERVQEGLRAQFFHQNDPYLRERLHDMDDLATRLLRYLTGMHQARAAETLPKDAILAARNMGPAALLDYQNSALRGVVLEEGAALAHVTIVARALNIALVGKLPGLLLHAREGMAVVADGQSGSVYLNPEADIINLYAEKVRFSASRQQTYRDDAKKPARTKDGVDVELSMTAGLLADLPHLAESGATGIGLFRTELHFMISSALPRLDAQSQFYGKVLQEAQNRPVMFRSLDIGGDKILPYMKRVHDGYEGGENPALGWRAIRISLDRPALLRYQMRALIAAAASHQSTLYLLFPMVSDADEFSQAKTLLNRELARAKKLGQKIPPTIKTGAMIEVPALLWQLDTLLPQVDFISIGSNDLFQFLFAQDRTDPRLSGRYDDLHPAALRALADILAKAKAHQCPVSLCGEMAASPLKALALIGLGFRSLALPAHAIGPVKAALRASSAKELEKLMQKELASIKPLVHKNLADYARKAGIEQL